MPVDLNELKSKAGDILQSSLGDLWNDAQKAGDFLKSIGAAIVEQTADLVRETDPARKRRIERNIQILIDTAYAEAVRQQIKVVGMAEDAGKKLLQTGLNVLKGALARLPIPFGGE